MYDPYGLIKYDEIHDHKIDLPESRRSLALIVGSFNLIRDFQMNFTIVRAYKRIHSRSYGRSD